MKKIFALVILATTSVALASDLDRMALEMAMQTPAVKARQAEDMAEYQALRAENVPEGPEAEFEYKFGSEENRWGAGVGQAFDWPGLYAARSKAASRRRTAFEQLYRLTVLEKAAEIKEAMIRYVSSISMLQLHANVLKNYQNLREQMDKAFERGEVTILEQNKVEIEQFAAYRNYADAESEHSASVSALRTICGGKMPQINFVLPQPELKPYEEYSHAMIDANPALGYAAADVSALQAEVSVARRSALPSFKLSYIHDFEENMHFNGFGVAVSLPTWNNKPRVAAVLARVDAAEQALAESKLLAGAELYADYSKAEKLQKIISQASDALKTDNYPLLLMKAFDAGRLTVFEYINEYTSYLEARIAYNEALAEYAITEARLGRYAIDF